MGDEQPPAGAGATGDDVKKVLEEMAQLREAMKAKDAQFDALKETYERTNAMLQTMAERGSGAGGGGAGAGGGRGGELRLSRDYAGDFQIPNEAVQAIVQETLGVARQEFDSRFVTMQQVAKERDQFYKDNPDLVGSEFLVGSISVQVDQELPNKSKAEKFKEVADRTRKVIKRYQDAHSDGDDATPPAGAGGGSRDGAGAGGGSGAAGGDQGPANPDAELAEEIAGRNKIRNTRMARR